MLPITNKLIRYNFSSRSRQKILYVVIHDTGNPRADANAEAHFRYFNGGNRGSSAHYFVDDRTIVQTVADENASWHCGDGRGRYGITNENSIGVEICLNADGEFDQAVVNTLDLTQHLMERHSIPIDRVVRHFDASRTICPRTMSANDWARWWDFKRTLAEMTDEELKQAVLVFEQNGLIDSPEYWLENARRGKTINGEYAAILIKRVAAFISEVAGENM